MEEEYIYENEDRRICESFRDISADSEEIGGKGVTPSYQTSVGSQILHREESSGSSESGNPDSGRYGYVYITENLVNGKRYIGQHKWNGDSIDESYKGSGKLLLRALNKYGWDNFKTEIIEWCSSPDELNNREVYWIVKYDAVRSKEFYNMYCGAGKCLGYVVPEERKERISNTLKSLYKRRVHHLKGIRLSDEHKKNIGLGGLNIGTKKVVCLETRKVFNSMEDAGEFIGLSGNAISVYLYRGILDHTCGGYHWCLYDKFLEMSEDDIKNIVCSDWVVCLETKEVYTSSSYVENNVLTSGSIYKALKSYNHYAGGLHWMPYLEYVYLSEKDIIDICKRTFQKEVICIESGVVYSSVKEANNSLIKGNVATALKKENHLAGGLHWMYYEEYLKRKEEDSIL